MSEEDDAALVCTPQAIPAAQQTKSPGRSPYLGDMVYIHDGLQWGDKCWRVDELIEDQLGVTMAVVESGAESRTIDLNSLCVVPTLVEQQTSAGPVCTIVVPVSAPCVHCYVVPVLPPPPPPLAMHLLFVAPECTDICVVPVLPPPPPPLLCTCCL